MQGTTDNRPDKREPISEDKIAQAVESHRANWSRWSAKLRNKARWDIETTLTAEVNHGRSHGRRATETGTYADFLSREVAAQNALGALHQATICRAQIRDLIVTVKRQRDAANDANATAAYRADWQSRLDGSLKSLGTMLRRRRRDWSRALELIAIYYQVRS